MNVAFFDIFGLIGFMILLIIGLRLSKRRVKKVKYLGRVITIISMIGLIISFYIVFIGILLHM